MAFQEPRDEAGSVNPERDHREVAAGGGDRRLQPRPLAGGQEKAEQQRVPVPENGAGDIVGRLSEVAQLIAEKDYEPALKIANKVLDQHPRHPYARFLVGQIFSDMDRFGLSYNWFRDLSRDAPEQLAVWNYLGKACIELGRYEEAERNIGKGVEVDPDSFAGLNNMLLVNANQAKHQEAMKWGELAKQAIKSEQDQKEYGQNIAMPFLALRRWNEGWEAYEYGVGSKYRRVKEYDSPYWDGSRGKRVIVQGEQGIGDEVMFASMIPDLMNDCEVVIESDHRLQNLFHRSFGCHVYGTRHIGDRSWLDHEPHDAHCLIGSLASKYRSNGVFPKTPYLKADPMRSAMWRAAFDQMPGKKIGLAWTGGTARTRSKHRSVTLEDLKPILATGHTFISLEYKGTPDPDYGVKFFPFATQTNDYDDTAALVSQLDCVVSVTTAVALLAGALGVPCHVLVPQQPTWHWAAEGDMPWFPIELHRSQGDWKPIIEEIACTL